MVRFVTLANRSYWCGLFALMQSIRENGQMPDSTEFVVIHEEPVSPEIAAALADTGFRVELVDRRELGDVASKHRQLQPRLEYAMRKLLVLRLDQYDKLALIDNDMICLNPLNGVDELEHFSAAPDHGAGPPSRVAGRPMFNTGFVVFRPDRALFDELLDYYDESPRTMNEFGDQSVLNWFMYERHPEDVHLLDPSWNKLKRVAAHYPDQFDLNSIRLLHYVGRNPWEPMVRQPGEWPYLDLNELWWHYFHRSPGAQVLSLPHGRPSQTVMSLLQSAYPAYRGLKSLHRGVRFGTRMLKKGVYASGSLDVGLDRYDAAVAARRSPEVTSATATHHTTTPTVVGHVAGNEGAAVREARKVALDESLAPWMDELVLGDAEAASRRLREAISHGRLSPDQIRHLATTLAVNGHPELADELRARCANQPSAGAAPASNGVKASLDPEIRVKRRRELLHRAIRAPFRLALRLPRILLDLTQQANRQVVKDYVRSYRGRSRAVRSYETTRRELHSRLSGRRVLLLGSGPTAMAVTHVPDDVVVVAVNRAPTRLAQISSVGAEWIWALCLTMGRDHWDHAERIATKLPPPSQVLLEAKVGKHSAGDWNAAHWERAMDGRWRPENPQYLLTNDEHVLDGFSFDHTPFTGAHLSLGVTMLRHVLAAGAAEVYLAGIDLGRGSRPHPERTYFYGDAEFTHDDGSPIISRQRFVHLIEEPYVRALSKLNLAVATVSGDSKMADYFPVKSLDDVEDHEHEPRAA